ncbi:MAG: UDP-N-acetylglucosamine 1-carboxyvinyltransferase [Bacilli bacterium]|nr:UDP-N-acetylglucosamine 1-carboxyvinyltransferase [Bacilli bacterium]MBQ6404673.1 UDP-N-acetylglucosamine 1-carboxyvinyltransferase [Bacilli bacterium]
MKVIEIEGARQLSGAIRISGAKNATVALIPAAILTDEEATICNVPEITDTDALCDILKQLSVNVNRSTESLVINPQNMKNVEIKEEYSKKLRASYYFMGALLGKFKKVVMHFPGGCSIGARPIDLHLKGFEALGAKVTNEKNKYTVEAKELRGANIYLDIASVGATINIMLAAVKAKGTTIIDNAAKEPEIVNVATFLNLMGAKITGAGTSTIKIEGVDRLGKCFHEVIPDRIEAGTYIIIGALCGHNLKIDNVIPEHIDSLLSKLEELGLHLEIGADYVIVLDSPKELKPTNIKTAVYPGFATDLQQPFTVLLTRANGKSKVEETIWENRFMHVPYLNKLGANITVKNQTAIVQGPTELKGCEVVATDLRAGAAMVAAGLLAEGKTTITNAEHILRGYEQIIEKLKSVGAKIVIKEI